ncbi:MAG: hypothetical protein ACLSGK_15625 [Lachnospiraceae bacterium]
MRRTGHIFDSVGEDMSDDAAASWDQLYVRLSEQILREKSYPFFWMNMDTPPQEAYVHGYWEELAAFIRKSV